MNSKERVLTAVDNRQPDKVPIMELGIDPAIAVELARILAREPVVAEADKGRLRQEGVKGLDLYCLLVEELGLDVTCTAVSRGLKSLGEGRGRDKFGTVYLFNEHGEPVSVDGPIKSREDLEEFDMVSMLEAGDLGGSKAVIDKTGKDKAHFVGISDPFRMSWLLLGKMETLLMAYILDPRLVHGLARVTTDYNKAAIDMIAKTGADGIIMNGDLAGEITTIMSPKHHREYIKPYHKEIVDRAHQQGLKIVKHSDGNLWPILDDLLDAGFDALHPIQPQCMDIAEVKAYVDGRMCLVGNIDCRDLLETAPEEEVEKTVKETIEKAGPGGGYIISSSNSIHPDCKPENYIAMIRAAHKYGGYDN